MPRNDPRTCVHEWAGPSADLCPQCLTPLKPVLAARAAVERERRAQVWQDRRARVA